MLLSQLNEAIAQESNAIAGLFFADKSQDKKHGNPDDLSR